MRNNRGSFMAIVRGLTIIMFGMILFIIVNAIFEGPSGDDGFFAVAEDDLNITGTAGNATYQSIKVIWRVVPLSFIIAGILYIIINTQREEPLPGYQRGVY